MADDQSLVNDFKKLTGRLSLRSVHNTKLRGRCSMNAYRRRGCMVVSGTLLWSFSMISALGTEVKTEQASKEAKAIEADAALSDNHPAIEEGVTCADCHEIRLDAHTTATQVWLTGSYAGFNPNDGVIPNGRVREAIVKAMGGKKHHRTCVLATCLNNIPLSTTAEYALDPDEMVLYGVHEKGTAKLSHLRQNPRFSLNWHREFKDWSETLCVQFIGQATLIDGDAPEFERVLKEIYPYEEGADARKVPRDTYLQMARQMMVLSKLTIEEATITDMAFRKEANRPWQRWSRERGE